MRKFFFVCCGHLSLATGVIGVFLPGLPTAPFVLLACGCYARGSERFHAMLLGGKWFGPLIKDWHEHKAIPVRAKALAVIMVAASITWAIFLASVVVVKIGLAAVGTAVSVYILTRPSRRKT